MNNELISVIVPIYNVEMQLKKCLDSIINQTYKNLEILLVDDGSTDNCSKICDEYKKKDDRIVVIHKQHEGLSSARNEVLDIAKGSLIGFVDSDDYIEPTMYETLKRNMDKYNSDISICNFYCVRGEKKKSKLIHTNNDFFSENKDKFINTQNKYGSLSVYAWNKLYKREIFENVRYPNGRIFEDSYILCDIFEKANIVSYTMKPLYNYVYRKDSIVNRFTINHFDKVESFDKKIEFFINKKYYDLAVEEKNRKIYTLIINLAKMKFYRIDNKGIYTKYYKELVKESSEIEWKNSSSQTKKFKVLNVLYIYYISFRYNIVNAMKKVYIRFI